MLDNCASGRFACGGAAVPTRPPQHRPLGWTPPAPKRTDPHHSTAAWQRLREQIKARDGHRCVQCQAKDCKLYVDHIVDVRRLPRQATRGLTEGGGGSKV